MPPADRYHTLSAESFPDPYQDPHCPGKSWSHFAIQHGLFLLCQSHFVRYLLSLISDIFQCFMHNTVICQVGQGDMVLTLVQFIVFSDC